MKTGRTLQNMAAELSRQAKMKRDYVVDTRRMHISDDSDVLRMRPDPEVDLSGSHDYGMSELFHRQLGASLGIPAKYYDKMREDYPQLLAENVNGWFGHEPGRHMIRTLDGTARAFLSDRYRRLDNYEIAQATLPVIGEMPDAQVVSCEITENRMYIKVVNPRLEAEVQKGDIVQAGIVISNSEVGLGSISVMPLAYRLVCLNGMIINDLGQRKYHIGRTMEESWELYSDETLQADDAAFMLKLQDIVRTAVDEARFSMVVEKLRESAAVKMTAPIPQVVELASKHYGFNQTESNDILLHLIEGGDLSLYGLSSAVTRASQDVADYDRATALEGAGWQIVTMPKETWTLINEGVREMSVSKYNASGYYDPTAYEALRNIERERSPGRFRPLVFVCSPLAGDYEANTEKARLYCRYAVDRGAIPIAPHLLYPQFMDDNDRAERELGFLFGSVLMSKCAELWCFGNTLSHGMKCELKKARERGMPIRYISTEEVDAFYETT